MPKTTLAWIMKNSMVAKMQDTSITSQELIHCPMMYLIIIWIGVKVWIFFIQAIWSNLFAYRKSKREKSFGVHLQLFFLLLWTVYFLDITIQKRKINLWKWSSWINYILYYKSHVFRGTFYFFFSLFYYKNQYQKIRFIFILN